MMWQVAPERKGPWCPPTPRDMPMLHSLHGPICSIHYYFFLSLPVVRTCVARARVRTRALCWPNPRVFQRGDRIYSNTMTGHSRKGRSWAGLDAANVWPVASAVAHISALRPTKCCWRLCCQGPEGCCAKCTAPMVHDGLLRHGWGLGVRSSRSHRLARLRRALRTLRGA
jgi:hypothetical protein